MPIENTNKELVYLDDLNPWFFPVPSSLCTIVAGSNHDFASSTYRTVISSPVIPDVVVDYDMKEQKYAVVHQDEVNGLTTETKATFYANNWSPDSSSVRCQSDENWRSDDSQTWRDLSTSFTCMRREVISHDDVKIPLTIIHSKELKCTGQSPGLLYGYGAYGEVLDKSWCSDHVSLLNRGWLLAYADVRGGGDASWHLTGSKLHKLNSIKDFAACGKYLVDEGYVRRNRLGAVGCSAGGLLVAATINKYPHLFGAAILKVPFLDICNTMLDPSLPLTVLDYDEFGHPGIKAEFENIRSYSPYDNIIAGICYPPMLVMASFHDSRVGVWEAAKWVARIREQTCDTCSKSVILKTDMAGGHFADSGRYRHCEDVAFEYAFLIKAMGMLS